jgi:RHS repeat-associated protein
VEADDPATPATVLGQYTYDAFGRRVEKVAGGITTVYFYDLAGHLVESVNTSALPNVVRDAIYLEDELVAVVDQQANVGASTLPLFRRPLPPLSPRGWALFLTGSAGLLLLLGAGASRRPRAAEAGFALVALAVLGGACGGAAVSIVWVHTDYLGKPLVVTNSPTDGSAPAKIWTATYEPYGLATPNTDPSGTGNHFNLDFRFPGQLYDAETGMHHNGYRDYDPTRGRYLEADPIRHRALISKLLTANAQPPHLSDRPYLQSLVEPQPTLALRLDIALYPYVSANPGNVVDFHGLGDIIDFPIDRTRPPGEGPLEGPAEVIDLPPPRPPYTPVMNPRAILCAAGRAAGTLAAGAAAIYGTNCALDRGFCYLGQSEMSPCECLRTVDQNGLCCAIPGAGSECNPRPNACPR